MNIDFNKEYTLKETQDIVYYLFERFNNNYGNIIDLNLVRNALNNIETNPNNYPEEVVSYFEHGAKGLYFEDKMYVKEGLKIDVLFHETLHFITKDHVGIKMPLLESYGDDKVDKLIDKYGMKKLLRIFDQLDESLTRFITELGIPEVKIEDAYEYGANYMRNYFNALNDNGVNPEFVLNMYLNGNIDDVTKFRESFGSNFEAVLEAIERINNVRFYILTKPTDDVLKPEEVNKIILDAARNVNSR